ncbi:MAG: hypothetical protein R3228_04465 [Halioglobus sp.]|nr:hypothetical protein [Halioglobus sp.]
MNHYLKCAVVALALGSAGHAWAECAAPEAPTMPDGGSATMDDMLAGQKAVKAYQAANLEYMNCLEPMIEAATAKARGESATEEDMAAAKALEEKFNAAVSAEEDVAGQFNTEIREYKAANPG